MKRIVTTLFALMFATLVGLANADETKGVIKEIDQTAASFTLEDGSTYKLGEGVTMENLKPGDEVSVSYEMKEGQKVATDVSKAEE
jgi:Cu/Ag efflux protein CusF